MRDKKLASFFDCLLRRSKVNFIIILSDGYIPTLIMEELLQLTNQIWFSDYLFSVMKNEKLDLLFNRSLWR